METAHLNPAEESISIYSQPTSCDIKQELRAALKQLQIKEGSNSSSHGQGKGHSDSRPRKKHSDYFKKKKKKKKIESKILQF